MECRSALLVLSSLFILSGCDKVNDLPIGKGFTAKYLCSYLFNSELDQSLVTKRFIAPKVQPLPLIWDIDVDHNTKTVRVADRIFLNESLAAKAIHREGMGCTVLVDKTVDDIAAHTITPLAPPVLPTSTPWPHGTAGLTHEVIPGLDIDRVNAAVTSAFVEPEEAPRNTTSLLVAYNGKLIAEQYDLGVNANTPLLGWSMTKTLSGTLIGILSDRGVIDIDDPAPIPGWAGTEKANTTTRDIVHMTSGLDFNEDYLGFSDVSHMLYRESDQIAYTASRELIHPAGTHFNYNTGDANLLAKIVHDAVGGTAQAAYDFYQTELFHKVDIRSAFIEVDTTGQFVGGAYGFMTARDWARMGQLYLQEGLWNGEQVLSSEWVNYVSQPSPVTDEYGGQLWLNSRGMDWPNVPHDAYYFAGHQGQRVVIIPSKNIVVVRTGVTEDYDYIGLDGVISEIIAALP
ncbi:hypothetical protein A9Q99_05770 [Gammaproteobacteria bacterium 45_16_T64]|nr:hypothetical protein A9Q99_05770 [Gammaproteobacteria bacterium 45_16_T64]